MRCLKLELAYDGTNFCGWQLQSEGRSVQGTLERSLQSVTGEAIRVVASGRTDAGVHALAQVVSLHTNSHLPAGTLLRAINANLPADVRLFAVQDMPMDFHAIRDARWKQYRYQILDGRVHDVFQLRYAWFVPGSLDIHAMEQGAQLLEGQHDFRAFQTAGSPRASTIRHIRRLSVGRTDCSHPSLVRIEIEANGYLYNMVRNIVGTLMLVGRQRQPWSWVSEVLASRDRRKAGPTAPPQGLTLVHVEY